MDILEFLKSKELVEKESNSFTIIKDEKEHDLVKIIEEAIEYQNDKYIRLLAEFENYKKRALKEKDEIRYSVKVNTLSSLLDVTNELNIGLKSVSDDSKKGIELTLSKIDKFLKKEGIEEIECNVYNEDIHEVISVLPGDKIEIVDIASKGYKIGDKIIRYPKVIITKPNE